MQVWAVSLLTTGASPPESNCLEIDYWYSEFDRTDEVSPCSVLPVLYPQQVIQTLTLKLFRREPAITKFDQLFTAYHKSSDGVERPNGSGLPSSFDKVHPAHGKITWLRVLYKRQLVRAINTRFPCEYAQQGLSCHLYRLVGSFFNRHAVTDCTLQTCSVLNNGSELVFTSSEMNPSISDRKCLPAIESATLPYPIRDHSDCHLKRWRPTTRRKSFADKLHDGIHYLTQIRRTMCNPLLLLVGVWFQIYFTPLTGVLFTFPSRYQFTIDL